MPPVRLRRTIVMLALVSVLAMMLFLFALKTVFLVSGALYAMLGLDTLPVRAGISVVIHLAMLRRVFRGISVERLYFWHALYGIQTTH